jgi:hypothetical protein
MWTKDISGSFRIPQQYFLRITEEKYYNLSDRHAVEPKIECGVSRVLADLTLTMFEQGFISKNNSDAEQTTLQPKSGRQHS